MDISKDDFVAFIDAQLDAYKIVRRQALRNYKTEALVVLQSNIDALNDGSAENIDIDLDVPKDNRQAYRRLKQYLDRAEVDTTIQLQLGRNKVDMKLI